MSAPKIESVRDYLLASEVTERKFEDGKSLDAIQDEVLNRVLMDAIWLEKRADGLKKHLIYDKDNLPDLHKNVIFKMGEERHLTSEQMEVLHHVLGALTECIELVQCFFNWAILGHELDVANLREEVGDLLWYIAGLVRLISQMQEKDYTDDSLFDIMQTNIDKLYDRFGDKFDAARALNRDLDSEREILERDAD